MAVQAEVPFLVCDLEIKTVIELRGSALSCHISVCLSDRSVFVAVHKLVLQRLAVSSIFLLVEIVCVWCIAHHLAA